jgi:hypothetical protein
MPFHNTTSNQTKDTQTIPKTITTPRMHAQMTKTEVNMSFSLKLIITVQALTNS